jgi:hypothetical protein
MKIDLSGKITVPAKLQKNRHTTMFSDSESYLRDVGYIVLRFKIGKGEIHIMKKLALYALLTSIMLLVGISICVSDSYGPNSLAASDDTAIAAGATNVVPITNGSGAILRLNKTVFSPNEIIQVNFELLTNVSDRAWIGVVPSHVPHINDTVNDENDLSWKWMDNTSGGNPLNAPKTDGTLSINAPKEPGAYDLRLNDNDDNGNEVAFVSFKVGNVSATNESIEPVATDKTLNNIYANSILSRFGSWVAKLFSL